MAEQLRSTLLSIDPAAYRELDYNAVATELDRLHAIEQEVRRHFLTADGVLVMDCRQTVYERCLFGNYPSGYPMGTVIHNLSKFYSTQAQACNPTSKENTDERTTSQDS